MHFCEQRPRDERDGDRLRVLHLSLNTPVVAIDELPVGPARAGIALCEDPEGAIRLEIAVRSLRTGQTIFYAPDEEFDGERNAFVAVDAALSFAEGMGFLFDEDEIAERGDDGRREAAARWRKLVGTASGLAAEPADGEPPRSRAEGTAPVLELVCEVPVQDGESGAEPIDVRDGDRLVLSDISIPAEATAAPRRELSKFRLAVGSAEPQRDEEGAVAVSVAPLDSRIRLLSRF